MATMTLLLPFIAFAAAVGIAMAIYSAATADRRVLQDRLASYDERPRTAVAVAPVPQGGVLKDPDPLGIPLIGSVPWGAGYAKSVSEELAAAAIPLRVGEYLLIRWLCGLALGAVPVFLGRPWILAIPLGLVGFYLPKIHVGRCQAGRLSRFNDQLGDALIMMSNALRSGASFLQAIDLVAKELPAPIGEEFGLVVAEAAVGASMEAALTNLTDRMKSYDLYIAVTAIMVQRQSGGSLAEVLETIAATIRDRTRLLRQVQVLTGEVRMSGYVVGLLPVIMLVALQVITPSYYGDFLTTLTGKLMLGAAFLLQILGFIAMRAVSQVDV